MDTIIIILDICFCFLCVGIANFLPDGSQAKEEGGILKNFVTNNLIIAHMGTGTCGLAVYMPKRMDSYYNELVFAKDSRWDDFVRSILIIIEGG